MCGDLGTVKAGLSNGRRVLKIWVSSDDMEEPVFVMVEFHLAISRFQFSV